jgi:hypothetical protein
MKRALAVAAVLAAAGCRKEPEAGPGATSTVIEWAQQSPDGRFELRQRRDGASCRVQAVVKPGDRVLWTSQTCLPIPAGLAFLSADGEKLLALDLFPSVPAAQAADWSGVPLASVWSRGAVVRQYTGGEILLPARAADMHRSLSWVRGDSDDAVHRSAHASADGDQVLVDLVDGRTLTFGFEGAPLPTPTPPPATARAGADAAPALAAAGERRAEGGDLPAAAAADPMASDEQGLYSWEDEQGQLHFGAGAQVPARFRKKARPVSASVGVLPLEHALPQVPKASAEPPAGQQKPPVAAPQPAPPPAPANADGTRGAEPAQPQQQPPAGERPAG